MKKILFAISFLLLFSLAAKAQPRAAGIRVGYGIEASYQHSLLSNFVEADLGFGFSPKGRPNQFQLTAVYDFVPVSVSGFSFYVGPGAQASFYSYTDVNRTGVGFDLGLVAQIGLEYAFAGIPLNLSLDWRPAYQFFGGWFNLTSGKLGVRYRF